MVFTRLKNYKQFINLRKLSVKKTYHQMHFQEQTEVFILIQHKLNLKLSIFLSHVPYNRIEILYFLFIIFSYLKWLLEIKLLSLTEFLWCLLYFL